MEMQVPPEQASMPDPGHMSDPHLTLTSLDLYAESPGHLQPVSFMSLSPCSCALSAKSCCFFQPWMLPAAVAVWLFPARTGCRVPPCPSLRETVKHEAAVMTPETVARSLATLVTQVSLNTCSPSLLSCCKTGFLTLLAGQASTWCVPLLQVAQGYVFGCQEYHVPVKCPAFSSLLQHTWFYAQHRCCCWNWLHLSCHT